MYVWVQKFNKTFHFKKKIFTHTYEKKVFSVGYLQ